ncbi:hypothetical protein Droror1_Dr00008429 [Drosera rotundifolia]
MASGRPPFAYNANLGHSTRTKARMTISPHHLMIKFLVRGAVGKMFGDQEAARQCYLVSLDSKAKLHDTEESEDEQVSKTTGVPNADGCFEFAVTTTHHSLRDANNLAGLLSIAEETLGEFLSKVTGTAVDWVQMPGMKPGPDSVEIFAISYSCNGVAATACGLVSLEPTKELLEEF